MICKASSVSVRNTYLGRLIAVLSLVAYLSISLHADTFAHAEDSAGDGCLLCEESADNATGQPARQIHVSVNWDKLHHHTLNTQCTSVQAMAAAQPRAPPAV